MIGNTPTEEYWRKSYKVEAVRLTLENMQKIADYIGADYSDIPDEGSQANITYPGHTGWDGDWILKIGDRFEFIGHEDFMSEYREETMTKKALTEEGVRRIVREELKSLLESMKKTAYNADDYETGELESAALKAIQTVVEDEAVPLPHGWKCPKRDGNWDKLGRPNNCNCGVGES